MRAACSLPPFYLSFTSFPQSLFLSFLYHPSSLVPDILLRGAQCIPIYVEYPSFSLPLFALYSPSFAISVTSTLFVYSKNYLSLLLKTFLSASFLSSCLPHCFLPSLFLALDFWEEGFRQRESERKNVEKSRIREFENSRNREIDSLCCHLTSLLFSSIAYLQVNTNL
jgi:hypothetical protein